jgi:hypothetical protein
MAGGVDARLFVRRRALVDRRFRHRSTVSQPWVRVDASTGGIADDQAPHRRPAPCPGRRGSACCRRRRVLRPRLFREMRWRMIGPHRGGRTKAAAGIPDRPNVFYVGVCNGGVWKTDDYGRTWTPIFDDQPTGSIGAIAIAPSNPDIIYVGSGEGCSGPTSPPATGSTSPPTRARREPAPRTARRHSRVRRSRWTPGPEPALRGRDGGARTVPPRAAPVPLHRLRETFAKALDRDEDTGAVDRGPRIRTTRGRLPVLWEERLPPWRTACSPVRAAAPQVHRRRDDAVAHHDGAAHVREGRAWDASGSRSRPPSRARLSPRGRPGTGRGLYLPLRTTPARPGCSSTPTRA